MRTGRRNKIVKNLNLYLTNVRNFIPILVWFYLSSHVVFMHEIEPLVSLELCKITCSCFGEGMR